MPPLRSGIALIVAALALAVAGCDGGRQETEIGRAVKDAPLPPPVPFGSSLLRIRAEDAGDLKGLPEASVESLQDLLSALAREQERARDRPGRPLSDSEGGGYEPSRAEIRVAELGDRIARVAGRHSRLEILERWPDGTPLPQRLEYRTFVILSVRIADGGFAQRVEPREARVPLGGE